MSGRRWPRATVTDLRYGPICECGNLKTDQALTCTDCAAERRRAANHWDRRTCVCGGRKTKDAVMCRSCRNESMRGVAMVGAPQCEDHPWRKAETARVAALQQRAAA